MDYIEEVEQDISRVEKNDLQELSPLQTEYLRELYVQPEIWESMEPNAQREHLGLIKDRFKELNIPNYKNYMEEWLDSIFGSKVKDSYLQLEAPQDIEQIEQISDVLADCKELRFETWQNLELNEKVDVLNQLENRIAQIEHRPSCPITACNLRPGLWGGYNPETKSIDINANYLEESGWDRSVYNEVIDTLVHEGRHAYQDYNVNECEVHTRHSEVESWAETMEGGKWGYWGDCSSILGQRLYEQQSIEIDARNFAADVIDKMNIKINA